VVAAPRLGELKVPIPPDNRIIPYAQYALAVINGTLGELRGLSPSQCPNCDRLNPSGYYVRRRTRLYCLDCGPMYRRCPQCRVSRSLADFRVGRGRVEAPCRSCTRENNRRRYHEAKGKPRAIPSRQLCNACQAKKPTRKFARDGRYRSGLDHTCLDCRKEQWQATAADKRRSGPPS
jgi:hypothetical protein